MKTFWIILIIIFILLLSFLTGIYMYRISKIEEFDKIAYITSIVDDECTEADETEQLEVQSTSAGDEKVSPNSVLTIKKLYTRCNHILEDSEKIVGELTNLNREEFQEKYKDWEIQKFTSDEIVLHKEVDDYCKEHYMLKETNGYIGIYELDKDETQTKLIKVTNIPVEYLAEEDVMKIEEGIKVYTAKELNKTLEDFE